MAKVTTSHALALPLGLVVAKIGPSTTYDS